LKPTLARGTRDFLPEEAARRTYIFSTIRTVFELFGFQPIETPAMENLSTLTGKYGEEGDRLIFKILNSGDFLKPIREQNISLENYQKALPELSEKALRYDLTVPFARVVAMHRDKITFPFKRYQIQPVWRADRPQKGRYREFYQCDADVVGSKSLLNEVDLIGIYDEVFYRFGLDVAIQINNRKILAGLAEVWGIAEKLTDFTIELDKLDKIGVSGVIDALKLQEIGDENLYNQLLLLMSKIDKEEQLFEQLAALFQTSKIGQEGLAEVRQLMQYVYSLTPLKRATLHFNITLARGLNYYTGTIIEVKAKDAQMGSIGGGGRYDDLTGIFGLPNMPGVGISFGADRIYDVLLEKSLFPENVLASPDVLFINFGEQEVTYCFEAASELRRLKLSVEIYPDAVKLGKQFAYADSKKIKWAISAGSHEIEKGIFILKNMKSGEQQEVDRNQLVQFFNK